MKFSRICIFSFLLPIFASNAMEQQSLRTDVEAGNLLCKAAKNGNIKHVEDLLKEVHPDAQNHKKNCALSYAARQKDFDVCKLLLAAGADINHHELVQAFGIPVGPLAIGFDDQRIGALFIEKLLSIPDEKQKARIYTFLFCIKVRFPGQYSNFKNAFKSSLQWLTKKQNTQSVIGIVSKIRNEMTRFVLEHKYFAEEIAFKDAVFEKDYERVKSLLHRGVAPDDWVDRSDLSTALRIALAHQDEGKMAKLLIDAGANVNHVDQLGITPLIQAAQMGWLDMCTLLLDSGADVFNTGEYCDSILDIADDDATCGLLIKRMINISQERALECVKKIGVLPRRKRMGEEYFPGKDMGIRIRWRGVNYWNGFDEILWKEQKEDN